MTVDAGSTIVGVFQSRREAERAIQELPRAGFPDDWIGIVSPAGQADQVLTPAADGAAAGVLVGGSVGALAGLAATVIMPLAAGPVIVGGILTGAAGGAAVGGMSGLLLGVGVAVGDAQRYEAELGGGRTVVTVRADGRSGEVAAVLDRCGAAGPGGKGIERALDRDRLQ